MDKSSAFIVDSTAQEIQISISISKQQLVGILDKVKVKIFYIEKLSNIKKLMQVTLETPDEGKEQTQNIMAPRPPLFETTLQVPYFFNRPQSILVELWDLDYNGSNQEIMCGKQEIHIPKLIRTAGKKTETEIKNILNPFIRYQMTNICTQVEKKVEEILLWKWYVEKQKSSVLNIEQVQMCVFVHGSGQNKWDLLYEFIFYNTKNPPTYAYNSHIPLRILTNDDPNKEFRIEIWNYSSSPKFMGEVITSYNNLYIKQREFDLIDGINVVQSNCPRLRCIEMVSMKSMTALDFFQNGKSIQLTYGIDYSVNNGSFGNSTCLHNLQKESFNYYQRALNYLTDLFFPYSHTGNMYAFGYGAIPPSVQYGGPGISQCYNIKSPYNEHTFTNVEDLISCYQQVAMKSQYMGVTQFTPIYKKTLENIKDSSFDFEYHILIYLATGEPEDLQSFIKLAQENINQPLSIIVLGMGGKHQFGNLWKALEDDIYKLERRFIIFMELNSDLDFSNPYNLNMLNELSTHISNYYFFHKQSSAKEIQQSFIKK